MNYKNKNDYENIHYLMKKHYYMIKEHISILFIFNKNETFDNFYFLYMK